MCTQLRSLRTGSYAPVNLSKQTFYLITLLATHIMATFINSLHFKSPAIWLFFRSETKKAGTYRAAPVNLRTFIPINLLYQRDYFLMQLCALTLDVGWSRKWVTEIFQQIVNYLVLTDRGSEYKLLKYTLNHHL